MKQVDFDEWFESRPAAKTKDDYFAALCRIIVGQQLSGKAARSIYAKFLELFPKKKPTAKAILKLKHEQLREVGLSNAKASYIQDLAKHVVSGELQVEKMDKLSDEEVAKELLAVKGLGPWSAEMFLMFTLKRENIFSHGDLGLKKGIVKVYGVRKPTPEKIDKIIKKWEPYKTYGAIALWESLEQD